MLRCFLCVLSILTAFQADSIRGDERQLPDQPVDYARLIRPQLPPGWNCTYDFRTLVISYENDVTFLSDLSLPGDERNEAFFKKYGQQGPYLIVLTFISRLTDIDQRELVERRQQAVKQARKGREHEKYTASDIYERHFVPEYFNERFSIDLRKSDFWPLDLVAPAEAVSQRDRIMKLLQANLHKYPTKQ